MESLMLVDDFNYGSPAASGPAKGDPHLLPLGLIRKPASGSTTNTTAAARQAPSGGGPSAPVYLTAEGCPKTLPPPPAGPPVMVLFPATLHLSMFLVPPPPATVASVALTLIAMMGSRVWGWGMISTAGVATGIAAGFTAGVGVRARPVGGWTCPALAVLGIAMLGGGWASLAFGAALTLSTLWRYGWWLYLNPECVPLLLGLSRSTADVALGFVLASLLQIYRSPPPPQEQPATQPQPHASAAAAAAAQQGAPALGQQADMWNAVTPPGLRGRRM